MNTIRRALRFALLLWRRREAVFELARAGFEARHQRAYLGALWSFLQPVAFIGVLYFVFSVGLRANPGGREAFLPFLICGVIAWQFFAQSLADLTRSLRIHSHLVARGDFPLAAVPFARLLASLPPHLVLILLAMAVYWAQGTPPGPYALQVFYYGACMGLLLLGLGWGACAASLFADDVTHAVGIAIQFGFWLTPIFWSPSLLPAEIRWLFDLNPMTYIVEGYRDSLLRGIPFWSKPLQGACFWMWTGGCLLAGGAIFRRLRPHFAEVL